MKVRSEDAVRLGRNTAKLKRTRNDFCTATGAHGRDIQGLFARTEPVVVALVACGHAPKFKKQKLETKGKWQRLSTSLPEGPGGTNIIDADVSINYRTAGIGRA
jgi:hypothetical protein